MLWDAVLSRTSELFLEGLSPEEIEDCKRTILDELCDNPEPLNNPSRSVVRSFPNRPGVIEHAIGGWHFRYVILNSNTIGIASIYYSPMNPKHPLYQEPT